MPGPMFKLRLRLAVREKLAAQGFNRVQIRHRMDELDDETIAQAVETVGAAEAVFAVENGVGALGDGTILKKIVEFLQSDLGQALIELILGLLI